MTFIALTLRQSIRATHGMQGLLVEIVFGSSSRYNASNLKVIDEGQLVKISRRFL